MLLRMVYEDKLAQAAYLIGCQKAREAIVIDPQRDIDRYERIAASEGLRITAVAETHIHADFLSGAREFAERVGAVLYLSDEGGPDWRYGWLNQKSGGGAYAHTLLKHGDTFSIGAIEFRVMHTPGHTPEHICFVVTDKGGGASEPIGVATGDFVFVGDLGRPDLLETAAGQSGAKEPAARALFASLKRFDAIPDFAQIWPGHGAGSACGKALGAVPQSTVGYEKRFNPAMRAGSNESKFVEFILEGQPEPPMYFARMKRENRDGPALLGKLPTPPRLAAVALGKQDGTKVFILDTRPWNTFREGHLPGAISAPLDKTFPTIAGSYVTEKTPIYLVCESAGVEEAVRDLIRIGLDEIRGFTTPEDLAAAPALLKVKTDEIDVAELKRRMAAGSVKLLDVRRQSEYDAGHLPGAGHAVHTRLPESIANIPKDVPIVVNCQGGTRSARACSYLERAGRKVTNLAGGYSAWERSGGEVVR